MNIQQLFQQCLLVSSLAGASACFLALLAYHFRNRLRVLHERWLGLGPLGRVVSILSLTVAVLYGGSKPPSSTNEPPNDATSPTNAPAMCAAPRGRGPSAIHNSSFHIQRSWSARGAYCDWIHVTFPDDFAFPRGTNLLTSITLFAWGEIREPLRQPTTDGQQIAALPMTVSLVPGESSVSYGLTPSNTFLVSWQNACANRDATNRADASIELFRSGEILLTAQPTNQPANKLTSHIVPQPPEGYVGQGQDDAWMLATFPNDYAAITNKGYEAWLREDYVGVNEQNGHVMMSVTIGSLQEFGPCYLVCGPHKMTVTESGTYRFPLKVFGEYVVRTYPTDLTTGVEIDDGYRGPEPEPFLLPSTSSRRRFASRTAPSHKWLILPRLIVDPTFVPYEGARNAEITLWKNTDGTEEVSISSFSGLSRMVLTGATSARILRAEINDAFEISLRKDGYSVSEQVTIGQPPVDYHQHSCCARCCGDYCECNGTCCECRCDCWGYLSNLTNETSRASQP